MCARDWGRVRLRPGAQVVDAVVVSVAALEEGANVAQRIAVHALNTLGGESHGDDAVRDVFGYASTGAAIGARKGACEGKRGRIQVAARRSAAAQVRSRSKPSCRKRRFFFDTRDLRKLPPHEPAGEARAKEGEARVWSPFHAERGGASRPAAGYGPDGGAAMALPAAGPPESQSGRRADGGLPLALPTAPTRRCRCRLLPGASPRSAAGSRAGEGPRRRAWQRPCSPAQSPRAGTAAGTQTSAGRGP